MERAGESGQDVIGPGPPQGRDVVFAFGTITWDDSRRHMVHDPGARLGTALLDHPAVARVMLANPFRSLPVMLARAAVGYRVEPFPVDDSRSLCRPFRLRRSDPRSVRGVRHTYQVYDERLRDAARRAGLRAPTIITTNPLTAGFSGQEWASEVMLYMLDDWSAADCFRPWWKGLEAAYAQIRERGIPVGAVSAEILERVAPTGRAAVIPNGLEPSEWRVLAPVPPDSPPLPRPLILYLGEIDSRLDLNAVHQIASRFSTGTISLVGHVADWRHTAPLRRLHNVRFHPRVVRSQVPVLVGAADVCVIPHVVNSLTTAMSPLKLYEYLAAGRPVAATSLEPIRGVDDRVVLVETGGDFAAGVAEALRRGPADEDDRLRFIEANSWPERQRAVLDLALHGDRGAGRRLVRAAPPS